MQENTNRSIAINTIILYVRMGFTTICALLTTRYALQALGIVDFGLYSVLGGIISFVSIFNSIMLSTSNRFIAVAIGKGNIDEANKQFNVNLVVHIGIAFIALIIAIPVGEWYIERYVNYDGSILVAKLVYIVSILGSVFSFVGVPYNGLLMAKEKFIVFSAADIVIHLVKLVVTWILLYFFTNKLLVYTSCMAILTALSALVFIIYCRLYYPAIIRFKIVRESQPYRNVFNFSTWVAFGAIATVGKNQGAAIIVNTFFDTVLNSALGVASSVNSYVNIFANNIIQPMQPQITKSYAAGNRKRTEELLIMSTKYTFLFVFLIGSLLLIEPEWILQLWLGIVPPFASIFLVLLVVDTILQSFNSGVVNIIWASGQIKLFQIIVSFLNVFSLLLGYIVLKEGAAPYYLLVAYIIVSIIKFFAIQWTLHRTLKYDNTILWKESYFPSFLVVLFFSPMFFLNHILNPWVHIIISFLYLCWIEWLFGLNRYERHKISDLIKSKNPFL